MLKNWLCQPREPPLDARVQQARCRGSVVLAVVVGIAAGGIDVVIVVAAGVGVVQRHVRLLVGQLPLTTACDTDFPERLRVDDPLVTHQPETEVLAIETRRRTDA